MTERVPTPDNKKSDRTPFADLILHHPERFLPGRRALCLLFIYGIAPEFEGGGGSLGHPKSTSKMSIRICLIGTPAPLSTLVLRSLVSTPNMTGRPGSRTMEMNGGSSASYLVCTPCIPLFCTLFRRGGNRRDSRQPEEGGGIISILR